MASGVRLRSSAGDTTLTFDALTAKWLEHEEGPSGSRKPSTLELRKTLLRKHVSPILGKTKAVEITAPHLRQLIDKLNRKNLSGFSVRGVIASVSCVLD